MLLLAIKNLGKERARLAISVGGVAFTVMLIVLLRGLFVAYENKVGDYFERIPADLWVVQDGTADFFHSYSIVPDRQRESVGDTLTLNGFDLQVTGISSGGDLVMFQYAYVTLPAARHVLSMPTADNALLVQVASGADPQAVAQGISALSPDLSVRTTETMVATNQRVITDSFLPAIRVLLVIGFGVGVAVIGLTIYSAVLEKRREFGVLKALGAKARQLTATVVVQALFAAAGGYLAGVGLAIAARNAAERWVPAFVADIVTFDLARVAAATVVMAIAAATIPLVRIARIDAAEVFRS